MAPFRFRRSFGNVGTRRFRGARPDATPDPLALSNLIFHGATSVIGGTNYQVGQLIHNIAIDSSGNSSVSVSKTDNTTDVDISNFDNTGTVSANFANNFVIRAIGGRNGVNSAIQAASTNDSIGVVGQGNPNKIDVFNGNSTELITWEIVNLNPALSFTLKSISIIRANFMPVGNKPSVVLTDFSSGVANYTPQLTGSNIVTFDNFGAQNVTIAGSGVGTAGSFITGITGVDGVGYGIYNISFDVTTIT